MAGSSLGCLVRIGFSTRHIAWRGFWNNHRNLDGNQRTVKIMRFFILLFIANALLYSGGKVIPGFAEFASTWVWPSVLLGYLALTVLLRMWIVAAARKSPMQFVTAVNGSTAVKMLLSLAVVTTYLVLVGGEFRVQFALGLFSAFAFNTGILVFATQNLSKKDKK